MSMTRTVMTNPPPSPYAEFGLDVTVQDGQRTLKRMQSTLQLDKELPAIPGARQTEVGPSSTPMPGTPVNSTPSSSSSFISSPRRQATPKPSPTPPHRSPARALAAAALGVSLSHSMLPPSRDQRTEAMSNGVTAISSDSTPLSPQSPVAERRSHEGASSLMPPPAPVRRKSRALLTFPLMGRRGDTSEASKDDGVNNIVENNVSEFGQELKPIARRASFWQRRRQRSLLDVDTKPRNIATAGAQTLNLPSLPTPNPISPFLFDTHLTASPDVTDTPPTSSGLQRRHSERSPKSTSTSFLNMTDSPASSSSSQAPPRPVRSPRRPSTQEGRVQSGYFADSVTTSSRPSTSYVSTPPVPYSSFLDRPENGNAQAVVPTRNSRSFSFSNSPRLSLRLSTSSLSSSPSTSSPMTPLSNLHNKLTTSSQSVVATNPVPKPRTSEESPDFFVARLEGAVSKAEIATILASSADPFYATALQVYIEQFDFTDQPLDIALRKLLIDVGLPKETQQIDRVMEAFAKKYTKCNPGLFASDDHPYILAFSMIMLHTDAFNKSNKRKMTKADYVKNVKPLGIAEEVLDYFYDNITYTPFIFIEDPLDINGQRGLTPAGQAPGMQSASSQSSTNASTTSLLGRTNKIDPYYMMSRGLLSSLRVEVEGFVPGRSPYTYRGQDDRWKEENLHRAFALADVIDGGPAEMNRMSTFPIFSLSVAGSPAPNPLGSYVGDLTDYLSSLRTVEGGAMLKVAKVGLLERKDDLLDGGKKASARKWKPWSVILTGSQLLFFRDLDWARSIGAENGASTGQVLFPHIAMMKFDELVSVKDVVAVHDATYMKHPNTLRVVLPTGRQFFLRADSDSERDAWIAHINYSSAFKTAGIRMRGLSMTDKDLDWTGVAAASSYLQQKRLRKAKPVVHNFVSQDGDRSEQTLVQPTTTASSPISITSDGFRHSDGSRRSEGSRRSRGERYKQFDELDLASPISPGLASSQLKGVFDFVKAELVAAVENVESSQSDGATNGVSDDTGAQVVESNYPSSPVLNSPKSGCSASIHSRSDIIRNKIADLESKINVMQIQLDSDLRYIRHLSLLTPFAKTTQDKIQAGVLGFAKKVGQVRLEMVKMECHRDVLEADLEAEEGEYRRAKGRALKAANEYLCSVKEYDSFKEAIPTLTLNT